MADNAGMSARAFVILAALLWPLAALAQAPCGGGGLGTVTIKAVRDVHTLLLTDGRTLRLAALDLPAGREAALKGLEGRPVTLKAGAEARDRYGRLVAFARAPDAAQTIQESLLFAGEARYS